MRETVTISLPKAIRRELDRVAKEEGVSRSDVLRQSLEDFLFVRRFRQLRQRMMAAAIVISSRPLFDGLRDVLARKFHQRAIDFRAVLRLFEETFTLVVPDALEPPTCRDHDDDVILATALAGECAAIVTGDQDLLILDPFQGIRVLAPAAFWKWESSPDTQ